MPVGSLIQGSLRSLHVVLGAVLLLPIASLTLGSYALWRSTQTEAIRDLDWRAGVAAENVSRTLETDDLLLRRMNELTAGMTDQQIRENASKLHDQLVNLRFGLARVNDLTIVGADGKTLVSAMSYPVPDTSPTDHEYFDKAKEQTDGASIVYSRRQLPGVERSPTFNVARRRNNPDGQFGGVVTVRMALDYFSNNYAEMNLADKSQGIGIGLFLDDGTFLVRTLAPVNYLDHVPDQLITLLSKNPAHGTFGSSVILDNESRMGVYRKINNSPIYVLASVRMQNVIADWKAAIIPHLLFGIPATLALIGLVWFSIRRTETAREAMILTMEAQERRRIAEQAANASRRMEAIGQLAGGIAHDFNNSLAVIMGQAELAITNETRVDRGLKNILIAAQKASRMIEHLLTFARKKPTSPMFLDIGNEAQRIASVLRPLLGGLVTLQMRAQKNCVANVDPIELEIALVNLTINARDAMPNGGTILITVASSNDPTEAQFAHGHIALMIFDEGVGMSPEVAQHAFEPFYTTKDVGRGSGLGLTQVAAFARQSGGMVRLSSQQGEGTTVSIVLPRADPALPASIQPRIERVIPPAAAAAIAPVPEAAVKPVRSGDFAIVLVEDEPAVSEIMTDLLVDLGCHVDEYDSVQTAIQGLETGHPPHLILSDIRLPNGQTGLDLAEIASKRWPTIPVVLMTGYAEQVVDTTTLRWPVLRKPVQRRLLLEMIAMIKKSGQYMPATTT